MSDLKKISFVVAAKAFFGSRPNETLGEFAQELEQLTTADRAELTLLLGSALGVEVV